MKLTCALISQLTGQDIRRIETLEAHNRDLTGNQPSFALSTFSFNQKKKARRPRGSPHIEPLASPAKPKKGNPGILQFHSFTFKSKKKHVAPPH